MVLLILFIAACDSAQDPSLDSTLTPDLPQQPQIRSNYPYQSLFALEAFAAENGWTSALHLEAGDLYFASGDLRAAAAHWSAADSSDSVRLRQLAEVYLEMREWSAARDVLRRLHQQSPENLWVNYHLGMLTAPFDPDGAADYLAVARAEPFYEDAAVAVQAALMTGETDGLVSMRVGLALIGAGIWQYAELAFSQAAAIAYPFPEAMAYVALARENQNLASESWMAEALEIGWDSAQVQYIHGLYLRRLNDFDGSLRAFLYAVSLDASNPAMAAELGVAYQLDGQLGRAERWLETAVTLSENDPRFEEMISLLYFTRQITNDDEPTGMIGPVAQNPDALASLAWSYYNIGNPQTAVALLDSALDVTPDNLNAAYYRGLIAVDEGDLSLAETLLTSVAGSDSPFAADAVTQLGVIQAMRLSEGNR